MDHNTVTLQVDMPQDLAWALAQLLKRIGYSDYRSLAQSDEQAYQMIQATEQVRRALADAGIAPRGCAAGAARPPHLLARLSASHRRIRQRMWFEHVKAKPFGRYAALTRSPPRHATKLFRG